MPPRYPHGGGHVDARVQSQYCSFTRHYEDVSPALICGFETQGNSRQFSCPKATFREEVPGRNSVEKELRQTLRLPVSSAAGINNKIEDTSGQKLRTMVRPSLSPNADLSM